MRDVVLGRFALLILTVVAWPGIGHRALAESAIKPAERVNTLSPDEARRAARARERAARLSKPAPAAVPKAAATGTSEPVVAHATATPAPTTRTAEHEVKPSTPHRSTRQAHRAYRSHRDYANDRAPRVGDTVSPYARLRPLPPGYALGASDGGDGADDPRLRSYAPRRAYAPQPYPGAPPYPRIDYGDEVQ